MRNEIFLPPFKIHSEFLPSAYNQTEYQWDKTMIGIDKIHAAGFTGKGIKIGILDTGLREAGHPDFNYETVIDAKDFVGDGVIDRNSHGTWVHGEISAKANGSGVIGGAYGSEIYVAKVLGNNGNGNLNSLIKGTEWLINSGCNVINGSLGFGSSRIIEQYRAIISYGIQSGVIFTFASGNSGKSDEIDFPSSIDKVFAVGAVDSNGKIAGFSNKGMNLDVVAPGVNVLGISNTSYGFIGMSGTSQAAPAVASFIACYMEWFKSKNGRLPSFDEIYLDITKNNTKDLGTNGLDAAYGYGLIYGNFIDNKVEEKCPELDLTVAKNMVYESLKSELFKKIYNLIVE